MFNKNKNIALEKENDKYTVSKIDIPAFRSITYPKPKPDDIHIVELMKLERAGIWKCKLIRILKPVKNTSDEVPSYPVTLFSRNIDTDVWLPAISVTHYNKNASEMLNNFVNCIIEQRMCPKEIKVHDKLSYSFFKNLCKEAGIKLTMQPITEEMHEDTEEYMEYPESDIEDDYFWMNESMAQKSIEKLRAFPGFAHGFHELYSSLAMLPSKIFIKLCEAFEIID